VSERPTPEAFPLETLFADDRGAAAILLEQGETAESIEYLEFARAGVVRGGHFHRRFTEHLFVAEGVLGGELLDCTGESPTGLRRLELARGTVLRIPPGWGHRFTAREASRAVAWGHGGSPLADRENLGPEYWT
jgi:dTDP-4-dehydrorhamnose 3,5-epimerase-like enzyme